MAAATRFDHAKAMNPTMIKDNPLPLLRLCATRHGHHGELRIAPNLTGRLRRAGAWARARVLGGTAMLTMRPCSKKLQSNVLKITWSKTRQNEPCLGCTVSLLSVGNFGEESYHSGHLPTGFKTCAPFKRGTLAQGKLRPPRRPGRGRPGPIHGRMTLTSNISTKGAGPRP